MTAIWGLRLRVHGGKKTFPVSSWHISYTLSGANATVCLYCRCWRHMVWEQAVKNAIETVGYEKMDGKS